MDDTLDKDCIGNARIQAPQAFDREHEALNCNPLDDPNLLSGPFWGELRIFLAVAKAKSFNKAAEALNMSQPTVSRQVRRLQDIIGSQLLHSSKSGIILTEKGRVLAEALLTLDEKLFSISQDLRAESAEPAGLVRLSCTEALAGIFIVPTLIQFCDLYSKVQIHIRNPINLMSFSENQCDVVLGYAPATQSGLQSVKIGFVHLIPVATQPYFSRYGVPTRSNLESHFFVDSNYYSSENQTWSPWRAAVLRGKIAHICDNSFAYAFMVKAGLGIGLLGNYTLAEPSIVPLDLDIHIKLPIFLTASSERLEVKAVRVVYDWIAQVFCAQSALFGESLKLGASAPASPSRTLAEVWDETPFGGR